MGRKKLETTGDPFTVRLSKDIMLGLKLSALKNERSINAEIRIALKNYLK